MAAPADLVDLLPHQPPFRLLQSAAFRADGVLVARQVVPLAGEILAAHFPGYPLWPGALLLEAMAQTTAIWMLSADRGDQRGAVPVLGVAECAFVNPIAPGTELTFQTRLIRRRGTLGVFSVTAHAARGTVARARITAGLLPPERLGFRIAGPPQ